MSSSSDAAKGAIVVRRNPEILESHTTIGHDVLNIMGEPCTSYHPFCSGPITVVHSDGHNYVARAHAHLKAVNKILISSTADGREGPVVTRNNQCKGFINGECTRANCFYYHARIAMIVTNLPKRPYDVLGPINPRFTSHYAIANIISYTAIELAAQKLQLEQQTAAERARLDKLLAEEDAEDAREAAIEGMAAEAAALQARAAARDQSRAKRQRLTSSAYRPNQPMRVGQADSLLDRPALMAPVQHQANAAAVPVVVDCQLQQVEPAGPEAAEVIRASEVPAAVGEQPPLAEPEVADDPPATLASADSPPSAAVSPASPYLSSDHSPASVGSTARMEMESPIDADLSEPGHFPNTGNNALFAETDVPGQSGVVVDESPMFDNVGKIVITGIPLE
jgi:hypothetical protein